MPTQKTFKRRVRARSEKTGESYTAARAQLIRRADAGAGASGETSAPAVAPAESAVEMPTTDEAIRSATGRGWTDWFGLLDEWGGTERRHPEIAHWLREEHGVDGWWAQSVTVGYERARGLRAKGQMATGFTITVNRTINASADRAFAAFTDAAQRASGSRASHCDSGRRNRQHRSASTGTTRHRSSSSTSPPRATRRRWSRSGTSGFPMSRRPTG
ncbi:MAG: DUF4287 domain-containing protein [Candidatus Limnocylindria bacterium]